MKRLWIPAAIILLLLAGALLNIMYLDSLTDGLCQTLQEAQAAAELGDLEYASQLTSRARETFHGHAFYLHVTLSHQIIDGIESSFGEVLEYLRIGEGGAVYTAANARLLTQLWLLVESEQLTLKNVF